MKPGQKKKSVDETDGEPNEKRLGSADLNLSSQDGDKRHLQESNINSVKRFGEIDERLLAGSSNT